MKSSLEQYITEREREFENKFVPIAKGFSEMKDWTKDLEGTTANYLTFASFHHASIIGLAERIAEEITETIKRKFNGFGGTLGFTRREIQELLEESVFSPLIKKQNEN